MNIYLDIYGTILGLDDAANTLPIRKGLEQIAQKGRIIAISDGNPIMVSCDLRQTFENTHSQFKTINALEYISEFNMMRENPKEIYTLDPDKNDLVIGDSDKDIDGAKLAGCRYVRVPPYRINSEEKDLWELVKHMF